MRVSDLNHRSEPAAAVLLRVDLVVNLSSGKTTKGWFVRLECRYAIRARHAAGKLDSSDRGRLPREGPSLSVRRAACCDGPDRTTRVAYVHTGGDRRREVPPITHE